MPVISAETHPEALDFTITSQFAAPIERVWQLWEDPRKVERWWGPPGYGATFVRHDFTVPGKSIYHMPGPDGSPSYCGWRFLVIEAPNSLEIENGFADEQGEPAGEIPWNRFVVAFEPIDDGTRMTITAKFESREALETLLGYGMSEGMQAALGQIDGILAGD